MSTEHRTARLHPPSPTGTGAAAGADGAAMPEGMSRKALQMSLRLLELVETRRRPAEMSQALAQVGRCLKSLAAYSAAESYLAQALRWATMVDAVDARVELICELAEVASAAADLLAGASGDGERTHDERDLCEDVSDDEADHTGRANDGMAGRAARERARDLAFDAATLATRTADTHWEAKVLLRVSDVLARCGDRDDAATMQQRALVLLGLTDVPLAAGSLERSTAHTRVVGPTTLM